MSLSLLEELDLYEPEGTDLEHIKSLQIRYRRRVKKCLRRRCWVKIKKLKLNYGQNMLANNESMSPFTRMELSKSITKPNSNITIPGSYDNNNNKDSQCMAPTGIENMNQKKFTFNQTIDKLETHEYICKKSCETAIQDGTSTSTLAPKATPAITANEQHCDNPDVFCNSALEAFIQAEFSALQQKTFRVLNELERDDPKDFKYETPSQQSGYVKTLEAVLSRQKKSVAPVEAVEMRQKNLTSSPTRVVLSETISDDERISNKEDVVEICRSPVDANAYNEINSTVEENMCFLMQRQADHLFRMEVNARRNVTPRNADQFIMKISPNQAARAIEALHLPHFAVLPLLKTEQKETVRCATKRRSSSDIIADNNFKPNSKNNVILGGSIYDSIKFKRRSSTSNNACSSLEPAFVKSKAAVEDIPTNKVGLVKFVLFRIEIFTGGSLCAALNECFKYTSLGRQKCGENY